MKKIFYAFFAVSLLLIASCTSINRTISTVGVHEIFIEPLTPSQYEILGEVDGYGEASRFLIFGSTFQKYSNLPGVEGKAAGKATYNAISKLEGADMLIAPRFEVETYSFIGLYKKSRVKVKAKAIQIKSTK